MNFHPFLFDVHLCSTYPKQTKILCIFFHYGHWWCVIFIPPLCAFTQRFNYKNTQPYLKCGPSHIFFTIKCPIHHNFLWRLHLNPAIMKLQNSTCLVVICKCVKNLSFSQIWSSFKYLHIVVKILKCIL
jgi:hypothetical protein